LADVVLENVSKHYGAVKAADNVTLKIKDKEFVILLGASGSGKTTTLRLISGLEIPTSGRILIGDREVHNLPAKDRDIAMVFQSYALYPHMTVHDNMAFPLRMRKFSKEDVESKVKKAAELLKIGHLLQRKPKQLSGGEQQRVALGRALVREPKAFLMDEPLSNLDAKLRLYMRAELKALQKRLGITTIYVTHDQVEAMTMADRIALMEKGSLLQVAAPEEIYSQPANEFVAGFIGSPPMNFVDGSLLEKDEKLLVDAGSFRLDLSELREPLQETTSGSEVVLGIRPEDIVAHTENKGTDSVKGEVYVVEPLGSDLILDIKVGEALIKVKASPTQKVSPGTVIWLTFDRNKLHVFDKKTGKTLV
jgi:multiple sugar transport system ATP-binding protein